jgi:aspartate/methionine/tyrosine aminotransferase
MPAGGYFVFPELTAYGDAETLARGLLEEAKVGVAPGTWYGRGGAGHLRLCYAGVPPDRLEEALARLGVFLRRQPRVEPGRPRR